MNATILTRFDVNFRVINMNAISVCFDVMLSVAIEKCEHFDNIDSNINVDVAEKIDETNETNEQMTADFFLILYVNSDVETRRLKLLTDFRARCSRICSWNLLLKLKLCLQRLQIEAQTICWIENFFIDFDADSNVDIWRIARSTFILTRMWAIWTRILAIDFAFFADKFDVVFVFFDVILNVVIERCELLNETNCKDIFVSVTRFLEVAKNVDDFCDENEHAIADIFTASHADLTVLIERDELSTEYFWTSISWLWIMICNFCEADRVVTFFVADFSSDSHTKLTALIERWEFLTDFWIEISKCSDSNVWEKTDFDWITKHRVEIFLIDSDTVSDAIKKRCDFFDEMTAPKIIADSNFCFDVAIEISDFCDADAENESSIIDFSSFLHINLTVLISRQEFWTCFFAWCSRTCSRNVFLMLKFWSQRMQIIVEIDFANKTNSTRKISIHSLNDVDVMTSCLLYQISNATSSRQIDNKMSKSDFRYSCWQCWKCYRNFAKSLNRRFSHVKIESKTSISWTIDVDFAICFAFNILNLIRFAFLTILRFVRLTTFFRISKETSNFCCFDEIDDLKENAFVKTISKSCNEMNFDWSSNYALTKSTRMIINQSSNSDSQ